MRLALTLSAAIIALSAVGASAQQNDDRVVIRHVAHGAGGGDTNEDGWLSRDEASAAADAMFARLDGNNDGRLTSDDRPQHDVEVHVGRAPPAPGTAGDCTREESDEGGERRVTVICRSPDGATSTEDRTVIIRRGGGGEWTSQDGVTAPVPPVAPVPPAPPIGGGLFFIEIGEESEADTNGDGALSREEFRAQQLRFFDARDVNGDRRVRAPRPPEPPVAPEAPRPPEPPRRR
jgi:hypothetical protein